MNLLPISTSALRFLRCLKITCWIALVGLVLQGVAMSQDEPSGIVVDQAVESIVTSEDLPNDNAVPAGSLGLSRREALIASLTIFSLAVFVGFEIITKVPPTLHTPLMSGSNAISGITLVGAALVTGGSGHGFASFLGMLAVALAAVNVVGGFMVTDRMLSMFQKKK